MNVLIGPDERLDDLERDGLVLIQKKNGFCFGVDAVLLSWFASAARGENVLDLCTGTGVIPVLMTAKTEGEHFTGLEILEETAAMAQRSVAANGLEDKITIIQGDVKEASKLLKGASFDVITVNPPYMVRGSGLVNPEKDRAVARHEILCTLEDVVRESSRLLKPGGRFDMVHRPSRLAEVTGTMERFGIAPRRLCMVHPRLSRDASLFLVEGVRGGKSRLTIEPPVILQEEDGRETLRLARIHGRA